MAQPRGSTISGRMREGETDLAMVRRHVREGAEHILRQREVVAGLQERGRSTATAEDLLLTLERSQRLHEEHLDRLSNRGS